jgi:Fic family protein
MALLQTIQSIVAYKWHPIENLGPSDTALSNKELQALRSVWSDQKDQLDQAALSVFNERLQRQLAIETGILERVYTIDRGITQLLIEHGIDASLIPHDKTDKDPELVAAMIRDHKEAVEGLFDFVKGNRRLSTSYIKELHALLTRHQDTCDAVDQFGHSLKLDLLRGEYKKFPNNPLRKDDSVHEYCPPEHVASEMDNLVLWHLDHEAQAVAPEVEAAWLHHRFSQIHPFQDGNGRVARILANLVFIRHGFFPLVVTEERRNQYIRALESADSEQLSPLVELFSTFQRSAFVRALSLVASVQKQAGVDQVIDATRELLVRRKDILRQEWEKAKTTAAALQSVASDRFKDVAKTLGSKITPELEEAQFFADSEPDQGARGHYFRLQIIEVAKRLGYFADTKIYRAWARLVLKGDFQTEILLSFHGLGSEFRGLLAVTMCFYRREDTEKGQRQIADVVPLSDDIFQINYKEPVAEAQERFRSWLEGCLIQGLEMWRQSL